MAAQQFERGRARTRGLTVAGITTVSGLPATQAERAHLVILEPERSRRSIQMTDYADAAIGPPRPGDGMVYPEGPAVLGMRIQPC